MLRNVNESQLITYFEAHSLYIRHCRKKTRRKTKKFRHLIWKIERKCRKQERKNYLKDSNIVLQFSDCLELKIIVRVRDKTYHLKNTNVLTPLAGPMIVKCSCIILHVLPLALSRKFNNISTTKFCMTEVVYKLGKVGYLHTGRLGYKEGNMASTDLQPPIITPGCILRNHLRRVSRPNG